MNIRPAQGNVILNPGMAWQKQESTRRLFLPSNWTYEGVLISPYYFPMSYDGIDSIVGKRGLFMCRIASLFLLQRLKGSMSGDTRDSNNIEMRAFFFLQGKVLKEIHAILTETLEEHAPTYATIKKWVAQIKRGGFSTWDAPRPGQPKTVTTPEIINQIHELTLEDHWISAKSIAEQMGISRERVGSIIHGHADALRDVGPEMPERGSKRSTAPVV